MNIKKTLKYFSAASVHKSDAGFRRIIKMMLKSLHFLHQTRYFEMQRMT